MAGLQQSRNVRLAGRIKLALSLGQRLAAESGSIISFGRALALELSPRRVNVLMSGVVDSPISAPRREQLRAWAESAELPAQRFGQPDDIAHGILFLMTNLYATAQVLTVDGGYSAK